MALHPDLHDAPRVWAVIEYRVALFPADFAAEFAAEFATGPAPAD
ncbi:hypothetical protein [Azospirillum baldaniorum]|nr:hypothetical protein [Azospirillum baldaniorum]